MRAPEPSPRTAPPLGGAAASDPLSDLELLVRSRHGLLLVETVEEERILTLLRHLADRLSLPLFTWTRTKGIRKDGQSAPVYGTQEAGAALAHVESAAIPALWHFQGLGPFLQGGLVPLQLKDAAQQYEEQDGALVLTGSPLELPASLTQLATRVRIPAPHVADYRDLLSHILRDLSLRMKVEVQLSPADLEQLVSGLQGLTLMEAEKVLTKAIIEDGRLGPGDIVRVIDAKREVVEREGLLEYYPAEEALASVADLRGLKRWLEQRRGIFREPARAAQFGLEFPKGMLLLGVPGCGKSLCAKAVATEWKLPLLKLDPSNLYNKYIGESERNFKRAMDTADRIAPVVLWIDEIEKAFASGGSEDGGVSQRILGTFLSWLQDRRGDVFVVATANDVTRLPPELIRKGRFDEVFFVDLPDAETRAEIFRIHLEKRGHHPGSYDLPSLAGLAEGFAGGEIEQVVVSALYDAFAARGALTQERLAAEISRTRPLSRTMAEKIDALRAWARTRTVSAH